MSIAVIQGDITKVEVEAIVNAANSALRVGGGVDGAINRAGGPSIQEECRRIGSCAVGSAVTTNAGQLPAKKVIHAVGPIWQGGDQNENALLASAYSKSLEQAREHGLKSVAFPNISTGIFGFPKGEAATIAITTVREFLSEAPVLDQVLFVCFDEENFQIYQQLLKT